MEALKQGSVIMLIGMSVVFSFLIVMIFVMNICAKIIHILNKYFPEEIPQKPNKKTQKISNEAEIALAIACAIHKKAQR